MFLFLAVVLYGTWIAMSVVEEKSSRVMEIILSAASPFELLAGKVLGVGGAALLQFAAMLGAALVALALQGQVASLVLGDGGGLALPKGLTPGILAVFSVYFVLGFLLYAVLFAAAGSLVSRQEDVNQVVLPMTLVATAGYLIGLYASIGLVDAGAIWVVALSWVPFLAPYMMLGRLDAGTAGPLDVVGSVVLMVATIVVADLGRRAHLPRRRADVRAAAGRPADVAGHPGGRLMAARIVGLAFFGTDGHQA